METIKVNDLEFRVFIPEQQIRERVAAVAAQISKDLDGKEPVFLCVLNGAFVFAADLIRGITTPCEVCFVRLASYQGTVSTGAVKELMGLTMDLEGRNVVIVEDIVDTGHTMTELLALLDKKRPASVHIATFLLKPGKLEVELDVPYCCFEIPNDFIVGYGLDYDGRGRNLPDIYTLAK